MRIEQLLLSAYGPFTDKMLDFSKRPNALQLVYGPNEAGKSSTLRALIGLFYGIDARTGDAHLHDKTRLRIGATLADESGRRVTVTRRKGSKNTLLDEREEPIAESVVTSLFGGLDRALFEQMFGLDHERLRQGAEALLHGGGQLGEVLFDASTGGRGVHTLIESLRGESEALFKARGRVTQLNAALDMLKDKRKQLQQQATDPAAYAKQRAELADKVRERVALTEVRRTLAAEKSRATRWLRVLPLTKAHADLTAQYAALQVADVAEPLRQNVVEELNRRFGSVQAQRRERPARLARVDALTRELAELRERLGRGLEGLETLDTAQRARVRKRVDDERRLTQERAELVRAEESRRAEIANVREQLASLPHADSSDVLARFAELEQGEWLAKLARHAAEARKLEATIAQRSLRLRLAVSREELARARVPTDAQVAELELSLERNERERERLQEEHAQGDARRKRLSEQRAELLRGGELVTHEALRAARLERDRLLDAWVEALARGEPPPQAMRAHLIATQHADALADRMVREAQQIEALSRVDDELERQAEQHSARVSALAELASAHDALMLRWRALVAPLGYADESPRALRGLLADLNALRDQIFEQAAHARAGDELAAHIEGLLAAIEAGADGATLQARLERATARARAQRDAHRVAEHARQTLTTRLEQLERERTSAIARTAVVERELAASMAEYRDELRTLGVQRALSPEELLACFDELGLIAQRTRERDALQAQLEVALSDEGVLAREVDALAARHLASEARPDDLERTLAALARVQQRASEAERDRARIAQEVEALRERIVVEGDGASVDELRAALQDFDPHDARAHIEDIDRQLDDLDEKGKDLDQAIGSLRTGLSLLEQPRGASELAEDCELELSRARALARRYVEARLALTLLSAQVERYRSEHQQPVLKRAGELFPRLTLHRYRGLKVGFDERDEPVLTCVAHTGGTVGIGALSDGTRDQLYLALRVASIERYFEGRPPLPLILDDALIHFDDARATAALEVLGELATKTQVLFFTHHARIKELARKALGEKVVVHELAGRSVPRNNGPLFELS